MENEIMEIVIQGDLNREFIKKILEPFNTEEAKYCSKTEKVRFTYPKNDFFPASIAIDFEQDPLRERIEELTQAKPGPENGDDNLWDIGGAIWNTDGLLGIYSRNEKGNDHPGNITLYAKSIAGISEKLNCNANVLASIVLLHELGHWASHMVRDEMDNIWGSFFDQDERNTEQWAQCLTYWAICHNEDERKKCFKKLEEKQRAEYQLDTNLKNIIEGDNNGEAALKKVLLINQMRKDVPDGSDVEKKIKGIDASAIGGNIVPKKGTEGESGYNGLML